MKKKLLFVALAALALIGCEKPQSELVLSENVNTATITGQVKWNPGGADAKMIPADSVEVRAIVPNAQYSAGAAGTKQFGPARTDKNGFYSITIPVGQVTINQVKVEVVPFEGKYTDPNTGVAQSVYYTSGLLPAAGLSLKAGDVKNVDIEVKPELTLKDYTSSVKISGKVTYDAGYVAIAGGYENASKPYANKVLKVKGTYTVSGANVVRDLENVTTDANGAYSFEVPAGSTMATINIATERFDADYTGVNNMELVKEQVYYQSANIDVNVQVNDVEKRDQDIYINVFDASTEFPKDMILKKLEFVVRTEGEVLDEETNEYKIDKTYEAFEVVVIMYCNDYNNNNQTEITGAELVFPVKASAIDGKITLSNIPLYSAWEGYDINVQILPKDLKKNLIHHYNEYEGFNAVQFKKKTWAAWHVDDDVVKDLRTTFWSLCWPYEEKAQSVEGYYSYPGGGVAFAIPAADMKYYGEYVYTNDIVMSFNVREPKKMMGLWSNYNYNTINDYDEVTDSYPALTAKDDAVDNAGETWADWGVGANHQARKQNKYQVSAACKTYWSNKLGLY